MARTATMTVATDGTDEPVNEIRLRGRVSAVAPPRTLPSGDVVTAVRLVVPRGPVEGRARVDVVDVACWSGRTRRTAATLAAGDTVEVVGALRRRFFRSGPLTQSRYEVEASIVRRSPARSPARSEGPGGGRP